MYMQVSEKHVNKTTLPAEQLSKQYQAVKAFWTELDAVSLSTPERESGADSCTESSEEVM